MFKGANVYGALLAVGLAAASHQVQAQTPRDAAAHYPDRQVTLIVPFAPGGGTDILARLIAQKLEQAWGKPFIVENRPGAGGVVGAQAAARAEPDGHTLFLASVSNLSANPTLYKKLPYDPAKDFVPLALAAATPFVLVVNPALPVKSVADLIAYVKARPGQINYASSGPGVPHHLYIEMLSGMAGLQMTMVPYKGSLPALNDVAAGHVPLMMVDLGPALGAIQGDLVRPLAVSVARRIDVLKDVPPLSDTVPGFDASGWFMMAAPAATPRPIVDKLHDELTRLLATPDAAEQLLKAGLLPVPNRSVEDLRKYIADETARWGDVIRRAGIAGTF
ncbi:MULTISPECIES: tripartite tricarboxylate transporter substrate binding protein [unclassified Beijerinckia]|uniref:Bug family tripartite tricarboxylate transporter substrate binding protein n=1 Tax=unclassified Beijerinckia TaxID=2638183 RepID=UPI0008946314|nr:MULTISPECIES: tripartite tricarboxylate transporter substrate binding protein [unclassified Beijerinckia]MDH7797395.1 tripartite-type tricarboxylate transporter receptor subunit TctC [Beijerinckia sp. GAS462]SEC83830.1 Tripartite-type tricarboxylate transporter, receptor component TctC [Beijerinckia sp. 28-YEA-48]